MPPLNPPFRIDNVIRQCVAGAHFARRPLNIIDTIMIHRIGPVLGEVELPVTAPAAVIARAFSIHPEWIGVPLMPYHFIVPPRPRVLHPDDFPNIIEQAAPLEYRTPHAKAWNRRAVGIALVGDFRDTAPEQWQRDAVAWICMRIMDVLRRRVQVVGHTATPDATSDPTKDCPGKCFPVAAVAGQAYRLGMLELRE